MGLPFTVEQFFDVFARYNVALWPAPVALTALAALCVLALFSRWRWRGVLVSAVLAVLWLWGTATFGLPCPTTLFTIGVLAWLEAPYPRSVLAVPMLWCLVGVQAAFLLDMPADLALAPAALTAFVLMAKPVVRT